MALPVTWLATLVTWAYAVIVNPTVGAAVVAALASLAQAVILLRHDTRLSEHQRRIDERMDERRTVFVIVREDDDETLIVTPEERRNIMRRNREFREDDET